VQSSVISKRILLFVLTLAFGIFSQAAYASLDGIFSGTVDGNYECDGSPTGYTGATFTIDATSPGNIINSFIISHPDFTYSASSGSNSDISNVVTVIGLSGSYSGTVPGSGSGATDPFNITINNDGSITIGLTDTPGTGLTANCTSGGFDVFTIPITLFPISAAAGDQDQVDPKITAGSTITTPLILKTQIQVIVSDLHHHTNDVLRTWKLRRKGFTSPRDRRDREREDEESSLFPTGGDGEVVANRSEQEDSQTPARIQRTESGFMMSSLSGMNAGDNTYLYGQWGSYSYTDFENDFAPMAFDGRRHGGLVGVDVSPWEGVLFGVAVGYEDNDIDTDFNLGNQETDGYTIAPYFGGLINDTFSISMAFGYSSLDTDQFRTLPATTTRLTSSHDSDRYFGTLNLNGLTTYGNWIIGGQIGALYATNEQDAYVETNSVTGATTAVAAIETKLAQFNIGADVAYSYGEFEPFARVMYENDVNQTTEVGVLGGGPQPAFDDDDVLLGFGLRYFGANSLTGNLEFSTRLGREDYDEYDISATLRYEW